MITVAEGEIEMPEHISAEDMKTANNIKEQCRRLLEYEHELRDEKARANKF